MDQASEAPGLGLFHSDLCTVFVAAFAAHSRVMNRERLRGPDPGYHGQQCHPVLIIIASVMSSCINDKHNKHTGSDIHNILCFVLFVQTMNENA